ncbi:MAG: hypothetical protein JWP89_3346 [Schlesneria sp.]|nr:hypothetical protein [Schlesneria sp.]
MPKPVLHQMAILARKRATPSSLRRFRSALITVLCLISAAATGADSTRTKPTAHKSRQIHGWTIQVDQRLLEGEDAELGNHALQLIASRLADVKLALGAAKVERLQKVTIWLDRSHGELRAAQYHPSAGWLKSNGYDEQLEKCVHIPNAADFVGRGHQRVQPWSVMHELAHAYHDQVLDFEHPEIKAAWERIKESKRFESVLHINGNKTRHYALTNQKEFFAEMTESYLGTNDFFPFNRAELKQDEPEIYALMARIWDDAK